MTTSLSNIETPAAVVDVARMQRNIARMQVRMNALGVSFRPHVKTTKCVAVADRQRAAGANGITVSTLREAEAFFAQATTTFSTRSASLRTGSAGPRIAGSGLPLLKFWSTRSRLRKPSSRRSRIAILSKS